jgi:hypothetical protein
MIYVDLFFAGITTMSTTYKLVNFGGTLSVGNTNTQLLQRHAKDIICSLHEIRP